MTSLPTKDCTYITIRCNIFCNDKVGRILRLIAPDNADNPLDKNH